jgi:hypothetical protein
VSAFDSGSAADVAQLQRACASNQVDLLLGLHAYRAGQFLLPLQQQYGLPFVLILGQSATAALQGVAQRAMRIVRSLYVFVALFPSLFRRYRCERDVSSRDRDASRRAGGSGRIGCSGVVHARHGNTTAQLME